MGYYFSNSLKTLTHWQSHKTGGGGKPTPVLSRKMGYSFAGIVRDGKEYYMPMNVWDLDAAIDVKTKEYYFPFKIPSGTAIKTVKYKDTLGCHFYGLYKLYENKPLHYGTADVGESNIGYDIDGEQVTRTFKRGTKYPVIIPVYNCYFMVQCSVTTSNLKDCPDWLLAYKEVKTDPLSAPNLAPGLFSVTPSFKSGDKIIKKPYGTLSHALRSKAGDLYKWGGFYSSTPYTVGTPYHTESSHVIQNTNAYGGSVVGWNPTSNYFVLKDNAHYIEKHNNCWINCYISREMVDYKLDNIVMLGDVI